MDRQETDNRLDALEKSVQAAQHSIMQSSPWQQQQQQQQNVIKQEVRQFETRTYETKTEQRQEQQRVSREDINGGYPRSMSPVWDNFEHVSIFHPIKPCYLNVKVICLCF